MQESVVSPGGGKAQRTRGRTPVMEQFFRAKDQYPDALLFFRMGDFYEFFYDDAVQAAQLLDLTLTSRSKGGDDEPIPMAGVPHHAATGYIARLLELGRKVAVCEQMADPSTVKGIVPREVVRVVTPGCVLDPEVLDARAHNYLVALVGGGEGATVESGMGLATLEMSTAELRGCGLPGEASALAELVRLDPRELLLFEVSGELRGSIERLLPRCVLTEPGAFASDVMVAACRDEPAQKLQDLLGADEVARSAQAFTRPVLSAAALCLAYAGYTQPGQQPDIRRLDVYDPTDQLALDDAAVRNLEIVRTLSGERPGSLLHLVDETRTGMGARLLRRRLLAPLTDVGAIRGRHDGVEALLLDVPLRGQLREELAQVSDLERLATRSAARLASPRELAGIRDSLRAVARVQTLLAEAVARLDGEGLRPLLIEDGSPDVEADLAVWLMDEAPPVSNQGGIVRAGADPRVDELRQLSSSSKDVLLQLEQRERARTGISSLKVKYTRVFGYYLEVTRANLGAVPDDYRRKQTVATGERFITDELEDLQTRIQSADVQLKARESELFEELRDRVAQHAARLRQLGGRLADLDVHAALAEVAHRYDHTRPQVDEGCEMSFSDLRHPIVERLAAAGKFVPNDVRLDTEGPRMMVITGPNMSGKSTTMRQVALATLLAQAGAFVPSREARIGVADRIYTRVGASDNLARGQSTFMVEMQEAAAILQGATRRSLVILDEIGRGTSTYDGLAIAWAVAEHLHDVVGCRTMFATHYHELCELAETRDGVVNFNVAAREYGDEVVFLHRLVEGGANRSYGVAVAHLAGVPPIVLARARALLARLEAGDSPGQQARLAGPAVPQMDLFSPAGAPSEVEATLHELDLDRMTPVQALVALSQLKAMLED